MGLDSETYGWMLDHIEEGDWLLWEPGNMQAFARLRVVEIRKDFEDEVWFKLVDRAGRAAWNSHDRVREACVKDTYPHPDEPYLQRVELAYLDHAEDVVQQLTDEQWEELKKRRDEVCEPEGR